LRAWKQTASGRRCYLYDGEELVCELDEAGNVVASVVFGANGLVAYGGTAYQWDPQGNVVHLLNDNGYATSHLVYDAWGQLMSGSSPTPSGFLLLTHRDLDPAVGRFWTG
jgi:YD repeat-containing protein